VARSAKKLQPCFTYVGAGRRATRYQEHEASCLWVSPFCREALSDPLPTGLFHGFTRVRAAPPVPNEETPPGGDPERGKGLLG